MEINRENLLDAIRSGMKQHNLNISKLERQAGVAKDTVRDFLRGKTQVLRADKLQKIMQILQPEQKVLVIGKVGKEAEVSLIKPDAGLNVECPPGYSPSDLNALVIIGDSLLPVFHDGWIIYYSNKSGDVAAKPKEGWQVPYNKPVGGDSLAEFIDKPCVIKTADGKTYLRTLKRGSGPNLYNLISYNSSEIKDAKVISASKILFIKT